MLKMAQDADLNIDDDLKDDIQQKLSGSKRAKYAETFNDMMKEKKKQVKETTDEEREVGKDVEETEFSRFKYYDDDGSMKKRRNKED